MITLISTPAYVDPADPSVICRWLATESPNNFRLQRRDFIIMNAAADGSGFLTIEVNYPGFDGLVNDNVSIVDSLGNVYVGTITNIVDPQLEIHTDIVYASIAGVASYMNDNTLFAGYYFEGRLTINGAKYPLTIIASPDTKGYADLDVSGVLRIVTSLGKVGNYTNRIMKETTKSGKFTFEFREKWYRSTDWGDEEGWEGDIVTTPVTSPSLMNDWYYGESVRSEEQGSNLHNFVADSLNDAPFFNQFENPVYFLGLPFDLSFILPEQALVSPTSNITVTIKIYDSNNLLLSTVTEIIAANALEGYINSLNIDTATIPTGANYFTAEITI